MNLIDVTPAELFDVVLLDVGASDDVLQFAETLGGDVTRVIADPTYPELTLESVISGASTTVCVVLLGDALPPDWLESLLTQPATQTLPSGAFAVLPVEAERARALWLGATATEVDVFPDLGGTFEHDVSVLFDLAGRGHASVGSLPWDVSERLRERMAMEEERRRLLMARDGRDVCWVDEDEDEPLVTVRIATYDRGQTVVDTAIASILAQTYERFELLVIGDHCDEATEKAVRSVNDSRLRFVNLPVRGAYPNDKWMRWLVAGAHPMNMAIELARGAWIAPCDDDDEFTPDHVETLLRQAKSRRLEFVWSKAEMEVDIPGNWNVIGAPGIAPGHIVHGTVMYSTGLRFMRMNPTSWKLNEPTDGNFWRRMGGIGVRAGFVDQVTYRHYLEGQYRERMSGPGQA